MKGGENVDDSTPHGYRGLYVGIGEIGTLVKATRQYAHSDIVTKPWFSDPVDYLDPHVRRRPYWWARDVLRRLEEHGLLRGSLEVRGRPCERREHEYDGPLSTLSLIARTRGFSHGDIYRLAAHSAVFPLYAEKLRMGILYRVSEVDAALKHPDLRKASA